MTTRTVQISIDEDIFQQLERRVEAGESTSVAALVQAELAWTDSPLLSSAESDAAARAALEEFDSGEDPGVPIEDVMRRYGMRIPHPASEAA